MNIIEILDKNSHLYPNATAVAEVKPIPKARWEMRWREFDEQVNKLANGLKDMGFKKGEKILLLGRNSVNWLEAYFAIMKIGAWVTPLNYRFTNDDISYCAKVGEPEGCIFDAEFAERISIIRSKLPTVRNYICMGHGCSNGMENLEDLIAEASSALLEVELKDEDECKSGRERIPNLRIKKDIWP